MGDRKGLKELKIRMADDVYAELKEIADRELRPISKQIIFYIVKGLNQKEKDAS